MAAQKNVGYDTFPKQGTFLNQTVAVVFHYDTTRTLFGVVVRDDCEEPGLMIIKLDDGRHVMATECQYQLVKSGKLGGGYG